MVLENQFRIGAYIPAGVGPEKKKEASKTCREATRGKAAEGNSKKEQGVDRFHRLPIGQHVRYYYLSVLCSVQYVSSCPSMLRVLCPTESRGVQVETWSRVALLTRGRWWRRIYSGTGIMRVGLFLNRFLYPCCAWEVRCG